MSPLDFLADLFHPDLRFLTKALAVAVLSALVCGAVGCFVVLRGLAFIGDAVAHAVFPGLAVAFVISGNLALGGLVAGVLTAVLVAIVSQTRRLREDSVIGVLFAGAFALGIVIISQAPGYAGSLQQFLFGSMTGILDSDVFMAAVVALGVLAVLFVLSKEFVTVSLDRESARAMGLRVFWLDLVLYVLVALAVVMSVQIIGNILVLALLVTPAATARLLTDRLAVMVVSAPAIGCGGALVGLYLSWAYDLPVGGTIVLVLTAAFVLAWLFAPRQGVVAVALRRVRAPGREARTSRAPQLAVGAVVLAVLGTAAIGFALMQAGEDGPSASAPDAAPGGGGDAASDGGSGGSGSVPSTDLATHPTDGPSGAASSLSSAPSADPAGGEATGGAAGSSPAVNSPATQSGGDGVSPGPTSGTGESGTPLVQPDAAWVAEMAGVTGIGERALRAYASAALALYQSEPGCGLGWNTLAAIGEVESAHGTAAGASVGSDGAVAPAIIGVALDGEGVGRVADTDGGSLDGDTTWDRAVGPMQFVPATWASYARDGNGDGVADPHQFDDAALSAGTYLCEVGGDLTVPERWVAAVAAYNQGEDYHAAVLAAATRYADAGAS